MTNWLKPVSVVNIIRVRLCLGKIREIKRERERERERVTWLTGSYISSLWSARWSAEKSPWWWGGRCRWWGTSSDWRGSHGWLSSPGRTSVQTSPRPQGRQCQSKSPSRDLEYGTPSPEPANDNNNLQLSRYSWSFRPGRTLQELSRRASSADRYRGRSPSRTSQTDIYNRLLESWSEMWSVIHCVNIPQI